MLVRRQQQQREKLDRSQSADRKKLRANYLAESRKIRRARAAGEPKGLAEFLGRVSGIQLVRKKLHQYQDKKRLAAFVTEKNEQQDAQRRDLNALSARHTEQRLDFARRERALHSIEQRELKSLEEAQRSEQRISARGGRDRMPAMGLILKPRGRKAVPQKAQNRFKNAAGADRLEGRGQGGNEKGLDDEFQGAAGRAESSRRVTADRTSTGKAQPDSRCDTTRRQKDQDRER